MTTHEPEHDHDEAGDDRTDLQRLSDARRSLRGAMLDRVLRDSERAADAAEAAEAAEAARERDGD